MKLFFGDFDIQKRCFVQKLPVFFLHLNILKVFKRIKEFVFGENVPSKNIVDFALIKCPNIHKAEKLLLG